MKNLILWVVLLVAVPALAQSIENPHVERWDENNCRITKIEVTKAHTVISFEHTNAHPESWVTLYDGIYLQSTTDDSRYPFVKAEGIPLKPAKHYYQKAGEVLSFKVYFKKLEPQVKSIDIIERAGATNYFNFFGVSLERSQDPMARNRNRRLPTARVTEGDGLSSMINTMLPMYSQMLQMSLEAQVAYFNQPDNLAAIAKINKNYYDALRKEGFTKKQAMDILNAKPLVQPVTAEK